MLSNSYLIDPVIWSFFGLLLFYKRQLCHCSPLGCPKKDLDSEEEKLRHKASDERIGVVATFGTAKRIYRVNNIRAKLKVVQI